MLLSMLIIHSGKEAAIEYSQILSYHPRYYAISYNLDHGSLGSQSSSNRIDGDEKVRIWTVHSHRSFNFAVVCLNTDFIYHCSVCSRGSRREHFTVTVISERHWGYWRKLWRMPIVDVRSRNSEARRLLHTGRNYNTAGEEVSGWRRNTSTVSMG